MAQKANYRFERMERERKKAAKKAERLNAKQEKVAERKSTSPQQDGGQKENS